jgi:putative ABC transport system permease protein
LRVAALALSVFAVIAFALAIVGTYAVTTHAVAGQRREIGIRMALGSNTREITWLITRCWLTPVIAGTAIGIIAGAGVTSALSSVLGTNGGSHVMATAPLFAVLQVGSAIAAAGVPVRRAVRQVVLAQVLRTE